MAGFRFSVYTLRFADYDVRALIPRAPSEMMFMRHALPKLFATLAVSASLVVACRGGDDTNTPTDSGGSGSNNGSATKIQDIQNDAMAPGTAVNLKGVVVTAIDNFGDKKGDIWVEEKEGGKRSGVHVFNAPLDQVAGLAVGDVIDLKGAIKSEFALTGSNSDMTGRTVTELEPANGGMITITKTGETMNIVPDKVDAVAIGQMYDPTMAALGGGTAFSNAWEDWEGVLIEADNIASLGSPRSFGSGAADQYSVKAAGIITIEGTQTDIKNSMIALNTCFGKMVGVVDYFYDYLLLPRSANDFTTDGTMCPLENAAGGDGAKCTDNIDNDGNGFKDCSDLSCETGVNAWLGTNGCQVADTMCGCSKNLASGTSVNAVNTQQATTSSAVYLRDVYITAINGTSSYWVADSLTAAANGGVLVFSKAPTGATVGQKIATLQGVAGPFGNGTLKVIEVSNATAGSLSAGGTPVPLTGVATDTLNGATSGAPYAGSLVTLTKAKVSVASNNFGQVELTDTAGKKIIMDDGAFRYYGGTSSSPTPPALGTCLVVTGIMDVQTTDQVRTINPRTAADLAAATGCP